jgi:hypothetical protein
MHHQGRECELGKPRAAVASRHNCMQLPLWTNDVWILPHPSTELGLPQGHVGCAW